MIKRSIEAFLNSDFDRSAAYHENIIRSLRELQRMKEAKESADELAQLLKHTDASEAVIKLIGEVYK